jgi:hypothetical protein
MFLKKSGDAEWIVGVLGGEEGSRTRRARKFSRTAFFPALMSWEKFCRSYGAGECGGFDLWGASRDDLGETTSRWKKRRDLLWRGNAQRGKREERSLVDAAEVAASLSG